MADEIYESPYSMYQETVQGKEPIYAGASATVIGYTKEIVAEFGKAFPEVDRVTYDREGNPQPVLDVGTGEPLKSALIVGGVFDLQAQAQEKGWTDEEIEMVRKALDHVCAVAPGLVKRRSAVRAAVPVATYDTLHHKQIPALMEQLGLVGEALNYERENKNRSEVVAKLEELLSKDSVEAALVAE